MKRILISLLLTVSLLLANTVFVFADESESVSVQQVIYDFLTTELDLTPAAAAGIMGNVMIECGFDPDIEHMDTNDKPSYGLMMWNGPRYEALKKWCKEKGYEKSDPIGQLTYLKWELENTEKSAYAYMKDIPNTIEGAARAAILWADKFERCTKTSYGLRVYYAINNYWEDYAGGGLSSTEGIYGYYYNVPDNLKFGDPLTLYGAVVSYSSPLKSITVGVYTEDGQLVTGRSVNQSDLAGNIGVVDRFVVMNRLPRGSYYYTITAVNESGEYIVERHHFTVSDDPTKTTLIPESEGGVICGLSGRCPQLQFEDMLPANHWAHDSVDHVLTKGYFLGNGEGYFLPQTDMSRAMFVTVLHRLADDMELFTPLSGEISDSTKTDEEETSGPVEITGPDETEGPEEITRPLDTREPVEIPAASVPTDVTYTVGPIVTTAPVEIMSDGNENEPRENNASESPDETGVLVTTDNESDPDSEKDEPAEVIFTDVEVGSWYEEHVIWAYHMGLVTGKGDGIFDPNGVITRGELAVLMYRVAEKMGLNVECSTDLSSFADSNDLPDWAREGLSWAVSAELINGIVKDGEKFISCGGVATREQVSAIVMRFASYVNPSSDTGNVNDSTEQPAETEPEAEPSESETGPADGETTPDETKPGSDCTDPDCTCSCHGK